MANKYSFLPPECEGCGETLTAPVAGMKGKAAIGYCPSCGAPNRLDVESPDEPAETTEPTGEGTGEGSEEPEGTGEGEPTGEGEGTGEGGEGSEES